MNWFGTTIQENDFGDKNLLQFPSKVHDLWECKTCHNIIYQKMSNYSPFNSKSESQSFFQMENVLLKFTPSSEQKIIQISFKDQKTQSINEVKIYCKCCRQQPLLAVLKPEIDMIKVQFSYALVPNLENIEKTKIVKGRTNFGELAASQSNINPIKNDPFVSTCQKLKKFQNEIQAQMMLWYQTKNFKIYEAFANISQQRRNELDCMKNYIMKLNLKKSDKEKNERRISKKLRTPRLSLSGSSVSIASSR